MSLPPHTHSRETLEGDPKKWEFPGKNSSQNQVSPALARSVGVVEGGRWQSRMGQNSIESTGRYVAHLSQNVKADNIEHNGNNIHGISRGQTCRKLPSRDSLTTIRSTVRSLDGVENTIKKVLGEKRSESPWRGEPKNDTFDYKYKSNYVIVRRKKSGFELFTPTPKRASDEGSFIQN